MVKTYENKETYDRGAVHETRQLNPNVIYNVNSGAEGLQSLIGTLDGFVKQAHAQLDKKTIRKAQLAGSMAGLTDNFQMVEGDSLAAEAYNRAGRETFVNKKTAEVSTAISKYAIDPAYRNDPAKLEMALQDYQEEYLKDIPLEMIPDFQLAFVDRSQRAIQSAQQNQVKMQISANAGQFLETETVLLAEITNAARSGDEAAIAQARTEYFGALDRQSGLSLMPEEVAARKIGIQRQIQKDAVIGEFMRTKPEHRAAFAEQFIEENPLGDMLTASEVDSLKREMISAWQVDDNLKEVAEKETSAMNAKALDDALATFHMQPNPENYTTLVTMEGVDPAVVKSARAYLSQNIDEADPRIEYELSQMIATGNYQQAEQVLNDPQNYGSLPRTVAAEYRQKILEGKEGLGFEKLDSYQEVQRRIKQDFSGNNYLGEGMPREARAMQNQIYDEMKVKYPKYMAGELSYEDVDPMRMYALKLSNYKKTVAGESDTIGKEISTSMGKVHIPQKYIDDPALYQRHFEEGSFSIQGLYAEEVQTYIIDKEIEKMKESQDGR